VLYYQVVLYTKYISCMMSYPHISNKRYIIFSNINEGIKIKES
jgi:hypothetical protein